MVNVEIVYVTEDQSLIHTRLCLAVGATVAEAFKESGLLKTNPEVQQLPVGIFSKQVSLNTVLKSGDRIEVYRKLLLDPKEKRRALAAKNALKNKSL